MDSAGVLTGRRMVVPFITAWSAERDVDVPVVERRRGGIGYAKEHLLDRDEHGVVWTRYSSQLGLGRPEFGKVHPMRQRRAMGKLLCQVCGGPADQDEDGRVLWLWKDHRDHWDGWPNEMLMNEPPTCRTCIGLAVRLCPALRPGAVAMWVGHCPVVGVSGTVFQPGARGPVPMDVTTVAYDDPIIGWVRADHLLRQIDAVTLVPVESLLD